MNEVEVARAAEVREGKSHQVKVGERSMLLTRVAGAVYAVENRCPHLGLSMARGTVENGKLECPWHGSKFDVCTGKNLDWTSAVLGMPMPRWSHGLLAMGKAPAPVRTFEALERDGAVFVKLPPQA